MKINAADGTRALTDTQLLDIALSAMATAAAHVLHFRDGLSVEDASRQAFQFVRSQPDENVLTLVNSVLAKVGPSGTVLEL